MQTLIGQLPKIDYMSSHLLSGVTQTTEPTRDQLAGSAIERAVDNLYLAMYCRRFPFTQRSVSHIIRLITVNNSRVGVILRDVNASELEIRLCTQLHELTQQVLTGPTVSRVIHTTDILEMLISRIPEDHTRLFRYIKAVLAIAGQITFHTQVLTVPIIGITSDSRSYAKTLVDVEPTIGFALNHTSQSSDCGRLWYRIFQGLKLVTGSEGVAFFDLMAKIHIDVLPDITNGISLSTFTLDQYLSCSLRRKYIAQSGGVITDLGYIRSLLHGVEHVTLDFDHIIQESRAVALESNNISVEIKDGAVKIDVDDDAESSDDTGDTEEDSEEGEPTEGEGDEEGGEGDAGEPEEGDEEPEEGAGEEPEMSADTGGEEDEPESSGEESEEDKPGEDKPTDTKPMMLGLGVKLAKDETLDDYLYKLTIANFIDNASKFNHEELPQETVDLLLEWKNSFLFLAAAEETKSLLTTLNIAIQGESSS